MAMLRHGIYPRPTTFRLVMPTKVLGMTSSRPRPTAKYGVTWGPGYATFQYPNTQRASTIWYHDHALGMTRLNVYAGPAGFYIIRGGPAGDLAVRDSRNGKPACLPGPAPSEIDDLAQQKVLRDPNRDPGSRVQRRWLAVLPGHARFLRRHHRAVHPRHGHLADLEPGVLRQHPSWSMATPGHS